MSAVSSVIRFAASPTGRAVIGLVLETACRYGPELYKKLKEYKGSRSKDIKDDDPFLC